MLKTVTIHQPNYLPWIGFFSKVCQADLHVILDFAKMGNRSMTNRNRIRTPDGWSYLTIPLGKHASYSRICDILLPADNPWRKEHWKSIHTHYAKTPFFKQYKDFFEGLYERDFPNLSSMNEEIIQYLLKCFGLNIKTVRTSELGIDRNLQKTDLLISCLKSVQAEAYLSGPSGRNYLEFDKFKQNGIALEFCNFQHPVYLQRYPGFEPNMSAIDLLFNLGPESGEIIKKANYAAECV